MQEKKEEEEPKMNGLMTLLLKKEEENLLLRQKLELLQNAPSLSIPTTAIQETIGIASINNPTIHLPQKDLSNAFLEEMQNKVFEYDKNKYQEYFELITKKKKWYGLGEEKLVKLFPCFSLLV
jgi:hypothetical protein